MDRPLPFRKGPRRGSRGKIALRFLAHAHSPLRRGKRGGRAGLTLVEMAVVLLVISILMTLVFSMLRSVNFLRSSEDEADLLRDAYFFAKRAALKSDETVYFELDIGKEQYRVYRLDYTGKKSKQEEILKPHSLSASNSLVAVSWMDGKRIREGIVTIPISPYGVGEEIAIYLGKETDIRRTVVFHKYGDGATVEKGEYDNNLTDPNWKEDLQSW